MLQDTDKPMLQLRTEYRFGETTPLQLLQIVKLMEYGKLVMALGQHLQS